MQNNLDKSTKNESMSLADILKIFSQIDLKIIDLHKCSSSDFMSLNAALKDNFKKAKTITEKSNESFDIIGEKGNLKKIKSIKNDFIKLKKKLNELEANIETSYKHLDIAWANLNMIPIPVNNFIQNLCVLKLLFSNIKLTYSFFDNSEKYFTKEESNTIENTINKIKIICYPFDEKLSQIQTKVRTISDKLALIMDNIIKQIIKNIDRIQNKLEILEKLSKTDLKSREKINDLSKQSSQNVESIITNLQYHDIIRQKMEHVQKSHKAIIEDLNNLDGSESQSDKVLTYIVQIPKISEIQTAQLLHANNEFQQAISHITDKMNDIGRKMTEAARVFESLSVFKHQGEEINIDNLVKLLSMSLDKCDSNNSEIDTLITESASATNLLLHLKEEFISADILDNEIEKLIVDKINKGNFIVDANKEKSSQAQQLLKLFSDNRFEKSKLKEQLKQTVESLSLVNANNNKFNNANNGMESIQIIINNANEKLLDIKEMMKIININKNEANQSSYDIISKNNNAIKEAKYYKYFEKSIDEIINSFNSISKFVNNGQLSDINTEDNESNLKKLEEYYTMKTERIIHNKTISKLMENQNPGEKEDEESQDGNDVEFF